MSEGASPRSVRVVVYPDPRGFAFNFRSYFLTIVRFQSVVGIISGVVDPVRGHVVVFVVVACVSVQEHAEAKGRRAVVLPIRVSVRCKQPNVGQGASEEAVMVLERFLVRFVVGPRRDHANRSETNPCVQAQRAVA